MPPENDLSRFIDAQQSTYPAALAEIRNGRKLSHWMWYIFPQIQGLGYSETAKRYAIKTVAEANAYLNDPVLGPRLIDISRQLLAHKERSARAIMGSTDDVKLQSSMTLFGALPNADPVFQAVLDAFFYGEKDPKTLSIIAGL